ncbi:MAG: hypothetical protein J0M28_12835 [Thauera sp.]|nr:hypothetical protein [Thauera sp.]
MSVTERIADPVDEVVHWLSLEPDDDPIVDLEALRKRLADCAVAARPGALSAEVLQLFAVRALDASSRLRSRLITSALPLPRALHLAAKELVELLLEVAADLQRFAEGAGVRWPWGARPAGAIEGVQPFALASEAFVLTAMSGAPVPSGFWRTAHLLCGVAAEGDGVGGVRGDGGLFHYRRILSVAVAQPESLTPREVAWLFDYLDAVAMQACLSRDAIEPAASAYWIDLSADAPPVAVVRHPVPGAGRLCHFSPAPMVRRVQEQIEWLEARIIDAELSGVEVDGELLEPDVAGLPFGLTPAEVLALLRRLRDRWSSPPVREQARRQHHYTVQVCVGLRAIWYLGRTASTEGRIEEWMVLNESPGGYAVMCVSGAEGRVSAGIALALRRNAADPWSVCIVRWVRSDSPEQIELGLQVVSQSFAPVQVGFRGGEARNTSLALMLPAMPPLRVNPVILAPAGTYTSRRFVFVREGPSLYVAQGRALGLDLQTANVEMFQYETDPYAL